MPPCLTIAAMQREAVEIIQLAGFEAATVTQQTLPNHAKLFFRFLRKKVKKAYCRLHIWREL